MLDRRWVLLAALLLLSACTTIGGRLWKHHYDEAVQLRDAGKTASAAVRFKEALLAANSMSEPERSSAMEMTIETMVHWNLIDKEEGHELRLEYGLATVTPTVTDTPAPSAAP